MTIPFTDLFYDNPVSHDTNNKTSELNLNDCNNTDISVLAYKSLPATIQKALLSQNRLVIIANNPSITIETLEQTLQPTDIVVLFNDFIHADFFATHALAKTLPKLLFFRQIGDSRLHFGLPPRSNNLIAIEQMAQHAALGIFLSNISYQFPTPTDDPKPNDDPISEDRVLSIAHDLKVIFDSSEHCRVLSEQHPVVADYPSFADIHSSAPTSGFLMYRLLLAARQPVQCLQRTNNPQKRTAPVEILLLGFNDDDKTAHFWEGHNWAFERQELAAPPIGVEIIRQY
ncbi:hypothetical protein ACS8FD_07500 [Psychrobacter sp. 1U2]|uniref:hypothetical protein n=1 Tax=Psychrobacter sp. 1U2 TaxID=3453577 RepID=UPI003F453A4B